LGPIREEETVEYHAGIGGTLAYTKGTKRRSNEYWKRKSAPTYSLEENTKVRGDR